MTLARWRRWPLRLLIIVCGLLAAACGPGVGGTGSGDLPDGGFGMSLCSSTIAPLLDCAGTSAAGTGRVLFADAARPAQALLTVEGVRATLAAACAGIAFEGDWDGSLFAGQLRLAGTPGPGTLRLAPAGTQLELRVFDAAGVQRLGPLRVERVAQLPAGC